MPRSRSLEIFSDPATWAGEVLEVDLVKGEKGLGFSILDYQVTVLKVKDKRFIYINYNFKKI